MKRVLPLLIVLILIISSTVVVFGQYNDFESSWAREEIEYLREKEVILGYPDGTFKPERNILKSEFYSIINHLIGFNGKADVEFIDVDPNDWYYTDVQKGLKAKYILEDTILNANVNISRGEAARILSIIFNVEDDEEAAMEFVDSDSFSEELIGVIGGFKKNGFINGFPDKTFRPESDITRAEAVKMLHDTSGNIVNKNETISGVIDTNVLVNAKDVVFKDAIIKGDLYLTEGIGEGDINLDGVVVEGMIYVKGGSSVSIKNSTINKMSLIKPETSVKLSLENTKVEELRATNKSEIELTNGSEISLVELDGESKVSIEKGTTISKLNVFSKNIDIKLEGTIQLIRTNEKITVNGKTINADTEINLEGGTIKDDTETSDDRNDYEHIPPAPRPVTVKSISNIDPIIVDFGTAKESIELPSKISLVLSNNTKREVNVTWNSSSYNENIAGTYIFKGSYNLPKGVTGVKPEVKITVEIKAKEAPVTLKGIKITKPADKLVYEIGEELDITGLEVTGVYSDGSEKVEEITMKNITGFENSEAVASQELTITIEGKSVTYTIVVKDKIVEPEDPVYGFTSELNKNEYAINENIILSGTVLKDNVGLDSIDITFKVEDSEGNLVTLDQFNSDSDGKFEYEFIVPEESLSGSYNLTINANNPINKVINISFEIKSVVVTGVTLNKVELAIEVEDEETLIATITPENATNKNVQWESSNPEVATVDENGQVIGVSVGEVTITATTVDGHETATCIVTVTEEVLDIEIDIEYFDGQEAWITGYPSTCFDITNVVNLPENAEFYKVVLGDKISTTGKVKGYNAILSISVEEFEAQLRVSEYITVEFYKDNMAKEKVGQVQVSFDLPEVPREVNITFENNDEVITEITAEVGDYFPEIGDIIVKISGLADDKIESVLIESSNRNIATITQRPANPGGGFPHKTKAYGKATSIGEAKIIVTVTDIDGNEYTSEISITVTAPVVNVTGVSLNKTELTLEVEDEEKLIATITPETATNKDVLWESSNPEVATVDENGQVIGVSSGETIITVTTADGEKKATCIVTVIEVLPEIKIDIEYFDGQKVWITSDPSTCFDVTNAVNIPENAEFYKVLLGDEISTTGKVKGYNAILSISVEEFEAQLRVSEYITVEFYKDNMAKEKVGQVQVSFDLPEVPREVNITFENNDEIINEINVEVGKSFPEVGDIIVRISELTDDEIKSVLVESSNRNIATITQRPANPGGGFPHRTRAYGKATSIGEAKIIATVTTKDGQVYIGELDLTVGLEEVSVTLTSIEITNPADKLVYEIGEELDITGLEVTGIYSDGSEKVEEVTLEDIMGFDSSEAVASQELAITIDGKSVTYTIEIKDKEEPVGEISIIFDYYEGWMPGYTFIEVTEIVNAPEDAKYYKVVIGDKESTVGSIYSEAYIGMTVEEFESLLKTTGGQIQLFTDSMATDKVAEVKISLEESVEEINITLEYFDGQEAWITGYPSTCFDITNVVNLPENAEFYKVVLGDKISKTGKVKGYNAILSISVEEFEAQLRVSEYITVEFFKDNMAKEKVGEVQVVPIFVDAGW